MGKKQYGIDFGIFWEIRALTDLGDGLNGFLEL